MDEHKFSSLYKGLFEAALTGGFRAIAEAAYLYFNRPIMLLDIDSNPLIQVPNQYIEDYVWDTLRAKKELASDFVWKFCREPLVQINHANNQAFFASKQPKGTLPRILAKVQANGTIQGFMAIICRTGHIDEDDLAAADIVVQAFSAEFRNRKDSSSDIDPLLKTIMAELFQGKQQYRDEFSTSKLLQNLNIKPNYCIAAIQISHVFGENSLLLKISKNIEKIFPEIYPTIIGNTIFLFITGISSQISYESFLNSITEKLGSAMHTQYLNVGLSNIFQNLSQLDKYKYQSEQCLLLGAKNSQEKNFFAYRDFVLTDIFSKIKTNMDPSHYLHPALTLLKKYDYQHNTKYFETLRMYITSICRTDKTIKALHIHRNSLIYRLNKIKEITGLDLSDKDTITHLLCSFYLIK